MRELSVSSGGSFQARICSSLFLQGELEGCKVAGSWSVALDQEESHCHHLTPVKSVEAQSSRVMLQYHDKSNYI